jgi:integrase
MGELMRQNATPLVLAGQVANQVAGRHVFEEHQAQLSPNSQKRQRAALMQFATYLQSAGLPVEVEALAQEPGAWHGVTWGIVSGFVQYLLNEGYAIGTVNTRLATVKSHCRLAARAGVIAPDELTLILTVKGYGHRQGKNIDEGRESVRRGHKKAASVSIGTAQAQVLKEQPDTPQGRRDALLMCLLLDHGLRVGEVAALQIEHLNTGEGMLVFYREKVDKVQTHRLTADTLRAALAYLQHDAPPVGPLLMGSTQRGGLEGTMGVRSISQRVRALGERAGLAGLSPHDCRHYWATTATRNGTDIRALQEAGGWSSPAMPLRYAEAARIANEGVKLS